MGAYGFALLKGEINGTFFSKKGSELIQGVFDLKTSFVDTRMSNFEHKTYGLLEIESDKLVFRTCNKPF